MLSTETNVEKLVAAGLLHDMGNMVKINFNSPLAKESLRFDENGADYWTKVKEEHIQEYGEWSHTATESILKKLEIEQEIVDLINFASWQHIQEIINGDDFEAKILAYADYRVIPQGVASLNERLEDLRIRYHQGDQEECDNINKAYHDLEEQLIKVGLKPEIINDESITFVEL
jgi:hypothetical protein